jgi:hypothetical protein
MWVTALNIFSREAKEFILCCDPATGRAAVSRLYCANADRRLSIIFYAERQIAPFRGNLGNFSLNGKNYLNFLGLHHPNDF